MIWWSSWPGYTEEMHDFLTSNPGLISRFNKYIDFPDYTDDELMAILEMNAKRQGYAVTDEAKQVVRGMLTGMTLSERMGFRQRTPACAIRLRSWCRHRQTDWRSAMAKSHGICCSPSPRRTQKRL